MEPADKVDWEMSCTPKARENVPVDVVLNFKGRGKPMDGMDGIKKHTQTRTDEEWGEHFAALGREHGAALGDMLVAALRRECVERWFIFHHGAITNEWEFRESEDVAWADLWKSAVIPYSGEETMEEIKSACRAARYDVRLCGISWAEGQGGEKLATEDTENTERRSE